MPIQTTFKDEGSAPVKRGARELERRAVAARAYRAADPLRAKAIKDRYRAKNPMAGKSHHLGKRYGLTITEFERMLTEQDNRCLICELPFGEKMTRQPCVDHDHATGRVRGLLHRDCNAALGVFRDSAALLRRAADYVDSEDTCL